MKQPYFAAGNDLISRRDFMKQTACGLCAAAIAPLALASGAELIPERVLGKSEQLVSMLGLNAAQVASLREEQEAIRILRNAIERDGKALIDLAWTPPGSPSQQLVARAIKGGNRRKAFLSAGTTGLGRAECLHQLEAALKALQTDWIDLWVIHESIYRSSPDYLFSREGAIVAATEARKKGAIKHLGFSGYSDPGYFHDMVHRFSEWDAVEVPINGMYSQYAAFKDRILPALLLRNIGLIAVNPRPPGPAGSGLPPAEKVFSLLWSQLFVSIAASADSEETFHDYIKIVRNFRHMPTQEQAELISHLARIGTGEGAHDRAGTSAF